MEIEIYKPETSTAADWQNDDFIQPWPVPLIFDAPENHPLKFKIKTPIELTDALKQQFEFEVAVYDADKTKTPQWKKLNPGTGDPLSPDKKEIWCTVTNAKLKSDVIPPKPPGINHASLDWCADERSSFEDAAAFDEEAAKLPSHTPLVNARGMGNWASTPGNDSYGGRIEPWSQRANKHFIIHGGERCVEVKMAGATAGKRVTCHSQADWLYLST